MTHRLPIVATLVLGLTTAGWAAEIYSNATGGGIWSHASTWRGGTAPGAEDIAVVTSHDIVHYDGGDSIEPTCARLSIDPDWALHIKAPSGGAARILTVAGPVDLFGTLRLDATDWPEARIELRLSGSDAAGRTMRVGKHGALLAFGAQDLPHDKLNVRLSTVPSGPERADREGAIKASDGSTLDLRNVAISDIAVSGAKMDNTGTEVGEGFNVVACTFSGRASLSATHCDTPRIADCRFATRGGEIVKFAIDVTRCSLPEITGNLVQGRYTNAIQLIHCVDATATDNTVERSKYGFYWAGVNAMSRGNTARDCHSGFFATTMTGLVQDFTAEQCVYAVQFLRADVQVLDLRTPDSKGKPVAVSINGSSAKLFNTPVALESVNLGPMPPKSRGPRAQSMYYLIVSVKNRKSPQMRISVRTEGLKDDAPDANVSNGTAPVMSNGLTPLPGSMEPIMVRGWTIGNDGAVSEAPRYVVTAWEPASDTADGRRVLATTTVQPDASWYRAMPNEPVGTIEMTVP